MRQRSEQSQKLYRILLERGYPEGFCYEVTANLNTDWTANRLIGYLRHYDKLPMEDIADEVLAILSDRNQIIKKKQNEESNMRLNRIMWEGFGDEE